MSYCAFFDLDETLIKSKSMLEIIQAYYAQNSLLPIIGKLRFKMFNKKIMRYGQKNKDRAELNRFYYQQFENISVDKMLKTSKAWFTAEKDKIFNKTIVQEIEKHQQQEAIIVLVTGSFLECVLPIAKHLNIEHIICAPVEKVQGKYTGKMLGEPTIGSGKSSAILTYIKKYGFSLENSYAYGDHESDFYMLSLAENPVVVGNNSELTKLAVKNNWLIINN